MSTPDVSSDSEISSIHIKSLSRKTHKILSEKLNNKKCIQSDENSLSRDWRGIIELCKLRNGFYDTVDKNSDHMEALLKIWCKHEQQGACPQATVGNLLQFLEQIDRFDVAKDVLESIDVSECCSTTVDDKTTLQNGKKDFERYAVEVDEEKYDAFVLFEEEDEDFACDLFEKLAEFKLCQASDIMPGEFKHTAAVELIRKRCRKVIVVISRHFLENPESKTNKFLVDFAQATQIENGSVRILPIIMEKGIEHHARMPQNLKFLTAIKFYRNSAIHNCWEKLKLEVMNTNLRDPNCPSREEVEKTIEKLNLEPFFNQTPPTPPEEPPTIAVFEEQEQESNKKSTKKKTRIPIIDWATRYINKKKK